MLRHDLRPRPQPRQDERGRRLGYDADGVGVDLVDVIDPAETRILEQEIVLRVGRVLEGIDHVVGGHLAAVVEFDAVAELQLHRLVVDLLPALGELAAIGLGCDVERDEGVEHRAIDEIGFGVGVLCRIDQLDRLVDGKAQRVFGFLGLGGTGQSQRRRDECGEKSCARMFEPYASSLSFIIAAVYI